MRSLPALAVAPLCSAIAASFDCRLSAETGREGERGKERQRAGVFPLEQPKTKRNRRKTKTKKETSERAVIFAALQIDKSSNAGIEVSEGWARSLQRKMGWIKVK